MSQAKELLPLEGSKSEIWKHFGFPSKDGKFVQPDKKVEKKYFAEFATNLSNIVATQQTYIFT